MAIQGSVIPVFRMFDEDKAREFYVDFLGFSVGFEHRHEANLPLYLGVNLNGCVLHLSEHHGDACPGSVVRIRLDDVNAYCAELQAKSYRYAKPGGAEDTPWGTREVAIADPFGNRLIFFQEM